MSLNQAWLGQLFTASGAAAWGCCAFDDLGLTGAALEKALALCPGAAGVMVAAYPYYSGDQPGNLSLYARGEDYHRVLARRLGEICQKLRTALPEFRFLPGADTSPLPERYAAKLAGVGIQGRNGLVIVPPYGSWVFLGTILTDYPLQSAAVPAPDCMNCGACVRACPGGALDSLPFDEEKCLSALTQKKGALTEEQETLLREHPLIWGCDLCQSVCPYNKNAMPSPLPDLTGKTEALPYLASLRPEDLEGLTNRTFREQYGDRAFAWRGPAVLRRNLERKKDCD